MFCLLLLLIRQIKWTAIQSAQGGLLIDGKNIYKVKIHHKPTYASKDEFNFNPATTVLFWV